MVIVVVPVTVQTRRTHGQATGGAATCTTVANRPSKLVATVLASLSAQSVLPSRASLPQTSMSRLLRAGHPFPVTVSSSPTSTAPPGSTATVPPGAGASVDSWAFAAGASTACGMSMATASSAAAIGARFVCRASGGTSADLVRRRRHRRNPNTTTRRITVPTSHQGTTQNEMLRV